MQIDGSAKIILLDSAILDICDGLPSFSETHKILVELIKVMEDILPGHVVNIKSSNI